MATKPTSAAPASRACTAVAPAPAALSAACHDASPANVSRSIAPPPLAQNCSRASTKASS
jgi:hypothetical protein